MNGTDGESENLKNPEKCENCVEIREERDFLTRKFQLQQLQIDILQKKYLITSDLLNQSIQKMAFLKDHIEVNQMNELHHREDVINGDNVQEGSYNPDSFLQFPMIVTNADAMEDNLELNTGTSRNLDFRNPDCGTSSRVQVCNWIQPLYGKKTKLKCGRVFASVAELVSHIHEEHLTRCKSVGYTCHWKWCKRKGRPFNCKSHLVIHLRDHTGERPFRCPRQGCGKTFKCRSACTGHLKHTHSGVRVRCTFPTCFKVFSCKQYMATHRRVMHLERKREKPKHVEPKRKEPKRKEPKRKEPKRKEPKRYMEQNEELHDSAESSDQEQKPKWQKLYKCKFPGCRKFYYSSSCLSSHMVSHMPNKVFECPYVTCDQNQKFKSMISYRQHLNTHTSD